jgi:hypothetical protein
MYNCVPQTLRGAKLMLDKVDGHRVAPAVGSLSDPAWG